MEQCGNYKLGVCCGNANSSYLLETMVGNIIIRQSNDTKKERGPTSPIPIKARIISKKGSPSFAAIGVKIVANDHQTTPKPNTNFPPLLSAHMPPTIYAQEI